MDGLLVLLGLAALAAVMLGPIGFFAAMGHGGRLRIVERALDDVRQRLSRPSASSRSAPARRRRKPKRVARVPRAGAEPPRRQSVSPRRPRRRRRAPAADPRRARRAAADADRGRRTPPPDPSRLCPPPKRRSRRRARLLLALRLKKGSARVGLYGLAASRPASARCCSSAIRSSRAISAPARGCCSAWCSPPSCSASANACAAPKAQFRRSAARRRAPTRRRRLTGAGVVAAFGSVYAAHALYGFHRRGPRVPRARRRRTGVRSRSPRCTGRRSPVSAWSAPRPRRCSFPPIIPRPGRSSSTSAGRGRRLCAGAAAPLAVAGAGDRRRRLRLELPAVGPEPRRACARRLSRGARHARLAGRAGGRLHGGRAAPRRRRRGRRLRSGGERAFSPLRRAARPRARSAARAFGFDAWWIAAARAGRRAGDHRRSGGDVASAIALAGAFALAALAVWPAAEPARALDLYALVAHWRWPPPLYPASFIGFALAAGLGVAALAAWTIAARRPAETPPAIFYAGAAGLTPLGAILTPTRASPTARRR